MSLDNERLGDLLISKIDEVTLAATGVEPEVTELRRDIFRAMAAAIIEEITNHAEVTTTVNTTVATTGTASAQTGTGVGTGGGVPITEDPTTQTPGGIT